MHSAQRRCVVTPGRVALIASFLAAILPALSFAAPQAAQAQGPQASAPFTMAGGQGDQLWPAIGGTTMVYDNCPAPSASCTIWGVDLAARKPFPLRQQSWSERQPDTDGATLVWADGQRAASTSLDDRLNDYNIMGMNLKSGAVFTVTTAPNLQNRPRVSGNIVVWADFRDAKSSDDQEAGDIYMYDMSTGKESLVSNARSAQTRPVTNGKVVVWVDYRNEPAPNGFNGDLYGYDIASKQEFVISSAADLQTEPAIWGNTVVWADYRKGGGPDAESDLYGYDLAAKKEFLISGAPGSQRNPSISGSIVVWEDFRNEPDRRNGTNSDIYGYDLATKQEFPIYVGPGSQGFPHISGGTVVWEDMSGGDWDVKGATLSGYTMAPALVPLPGTGSTTFKETGKTVTGLFLDYWNKNGGLAQQGFPISGVMGEVSDLNGQLYTVQYFERAVFEYHPEVQDPKYRVLLSQLGTFQYRKKYGAQGAPNQTVNNSPGSVLFKETGHRVGGKFLTYWQSHGGLAQQGFPISDEFTEVSDLNGKPYTVQYFERAVFELHPENAGTPYEVLLSQLGTFQYRTKYAGK